jgi:hypothetical protein
MINTMQKNVCKKVKVIHPGLRRKMRRKVWENSSLSAVEMGW